MLPLEGELAAQPTEGVGTVLLAAGQFSASPLGKLSSEARLMRGSSRVPESKQRADIRSYG